MRAPTYAMTHVRMLGKIFFKKKRETEILYSLYVQ